jgi:hypothetical protein
MAYWAEVDEDNIVIQITVGSDNESDKGYSWLINNLGGSWIETSYENNLRKNYANIGCIYDEKRDIFYQPFYMGEYDRSLCYFAKIDSSSAVIDIDTVNKSDINMANEENNGIAYLNEKHGQTFNWKQTKYHPSFRKNFAQVGYTYDQNADAFIPPMPIDGNWVLDTGTYRWEQA